MKPDVCIMIEHMGAKLCGSRAMANRWPDVCKINENTDWDYFCQDGEIDKGRIEVMGFEKVSINPDYFDDLLAEMYVNKDANCQLLFRTNADLYERAIKSIDLRTWIYRLWKSSPFLTIREEDMGWFKISVREYFNHMFAQVEQADDLPF